MTVDPIETEAGFEAALQAKIDKRYGEDAWTAKLDLEAGNISYLCNNGVFPGREVLLRLPNRVLGFGPDVARTVLGELLAEFEIALSKR
jgi:hypothetical protein